MKREKIFNHEETKEQKNKTKKRKNLYRGGAGAARNYRPLLWSFVRLAALSKALSF
jgi:hypothetical protein